MKRLTLLLALVVVVFSVALASKRVDQVTVDLAIVDSLSSDTTTLDSVRASKYALGQTPIILETQVDGYSSVRGNVTVTYGDVDTAAAGTPADTTLDTVLVRIYTAGDHTATDDIVVHTTKLVPDADGETYWFNISDSTLGDRIYFEVLAWIKDSTAELARDSLGAEYNINFKLFLR